VNSPGSTANLLILAYEGSSAFFASTIRATRSTTAGWRASSAWSVVGSAQSRPNVAVPVGFRVISATG
jgi:hypothetical protein